MEYRRVNDTYILRLDPGEEIMASLASLCEREEIVLAKIEGLGAADHAVVGLFDVGSKEFHKRSFDVPLELSSIIGNVTRQDGKVYLHVHVNLCDSDLNAYGGHLVECRISATAEIFITVLDGRVNRRFDDVIGLNLFDFED